MHLESLRPGDIVDLVAPASKCSKAELAQGVRAIRELGLVPRVPKDIFAKSILFSNSDEKRLAQLRRALYATDSKMIWCVRGGYGVIRLVPEMMKWKKPKKAKLVWGYSDITTLHLHLNQQWGWPTVHGPQVDRFGRGVIKGAELKLIHGILFGDIDEIDYPKLRPLNSAARKAGKISGVVVGGNMAVLQSAMGTPSQLKTTGKILFFEDISERPHRVDRMLTQFVQAGWFKSARAVVFGDFVNNDTKDLRDIWQDVIPRFAEAQKIPVLRGLPSGHNPKCQWPLPFNSSAVLFTGTSGHLMVKSPVEMA